MAVIPQKCRLCGKSCTGAQGRGVHEKKCAKDHGAKLVGHGADRHFLMADGKQIAAPNAKSTAYNTKRAKSIQMAGRANRIAVLQKPSRKPRKGECSLCGKTVNILGLSGHLHGHVKKGEATWKNGISSGAEKELVPTALGRMRYNIEAAPSLEDPSGSEIVQQHFEPTAEQIYAAETSLSHQALHALQKATALMQFSLLIEEVGPQQALAMMNGLSKISKAMRK